MCRSVHRLHSLTDTLLSHLGFSPGEYGHVSGMIVAPLSSTLIPAAVSRKAWVVGLLVSFSAYSQGMVIWTYRSHF